MKTLLGWSAILMSALFIPFSASAEVASGAEKAAAIKAHQIICGESSANDSDDGSDAVTVAKITVQLDGSGKAISLKIDRPASDGMLEIHSKFTAENDSINHTVEQQESDTTNITDVETILARNQAGDVVHLHVNDHMYSGWAGSTLEIAFGGKTFSTQEAGVSVSCTGQVKFNAGYDSGADIGEGDGELLP
jgi:ABC-type glycerol-3-phosphate transport system substrate-binding protein